jgi:predicted PilT family ATPase
MPKISTLGKEIDFEKEETGAYLVLVFDERLSGKIANLYAGSEYLMSATIGKNGQLRVAKDSEVGKNVLKALVKNELKVFI